jgi:Domain of unknown function (DUF4357)
MGTATIKVFLAHGDAKRLRTAELSNWTGKAVAGPRSEFDDVLARDESSKAGVYFLTGVDPETGKPAIYVGEAESIRDRVKSHLDKDFWNQIVFVVSKDEKGVKARGRRTPNGFVVLKGSQAVLRERPSTEKYPLPRQARDQLRNDGLLVEQAGALVFTRDVEFASPSAAASAIHGGHANGLIAWRNTEGTTLKEIEAA